MLEFNWRQWSWGKFGGKSTTSKAARRKAARPLIELLEERTLLSFSSPIITDYDPIAGYLTQEATGDFNGDGNVDIATLSYLQIFNPLVLTVLNGNGDGTFQAQASINLSPATDYTSFNLAVGRVNGDNFDDLVMLEGSFDMQVYWGSSGGLSTANSTVTHLTPNLPSGMPIQSGEIVLGHFTQADRLDAAILPLFGNAMRLMVNQGDGTFVENIYPLPSFNSQSVDFNINLQNFDEGNQILAEDLNHDGIDDAIFSFGGLGVFPNQQSGVLTIKKTAGPEGFTVSALAPDSLGQDVQGGDLDGDGLLDLAINSLERTGGLRLLRGQADGSFVPFATSPFINVSPDTPIESMVFGDVVGGTTADLVFNPANGIPDVDHGGDSFVFAVAAGQGSAVFGTTKFINRHVSGSNESLITQAGRILIADVNHDGSQDLINIYRNFNFGQHARTSVLLNTGGTHTTLQFPDIEEGSPITIVATVAKNVAEAEGIPAGIVTFMEGTTILGQALLIDGVATSDLLFLDAGLHTIHAVYPGDDQFLSSVAGTTQINVIVNPGRTKTALMFPNLMEGQTLVQAEVTKYFAATQGIPSGQVTFKEGSQVIGQGTLVGGQLVTSLDLGPGTHTVFAVYDGDGTFTANTSKSFLITVQPAPLPDLGLLHIEVEGEGLHLNRTNLHFEANGVIHFGLSQEPFQSLIDLAGSISIGDGKIVGDGTVTAHIGNFSAVLFTGAFQFDIGDAHSNEFHAPAIPGGLKIAGLDIDYNQLELIDGGINLGGRLHLPNLLGNQVVDFAVGAGIHIDANGISSHFGGGRIGFPAVNFPLAELGISASDLNVDYDADQDRLKIQGKVGLPELFGGFISGVKLDLAGDNFIQIKNGAVDLSGDLMIVKPIDIVPNTWTLKNVKLHVNTLTNAFEGEATLVFPGGFGVKVELGLVNGQLDTVGVGVSGLNVAVPFLPGAFLKSLGGSVTGLTTNHPTFTGDAGFTYLPHISFDLPPILGGQHFSVSIVSLDVTAEIDNQHLSATGSVELLKGVSGTGQNNGAPASVDFNWLKKSIEISTEMHLINNIVNLEINFTGNSGGNVTFQADASISLPDIDTGVLGIHIKPVTLAGAHAEFHFTNDQNIANDFVSLYGNVDLPVIGKRRIGVKLYFNGKVDFIGLKDPVGQTFNIPAGSDMYLLTASWQNNVGDVPIEIVDPNGTVYTEADFDNVNIGLIDVLSGTASKSIGLANPIPGNWTINIPNEAGLGEIAFHGFFELAPPTLAVTSATAGANAVTIGYNATSDEPAATVAWYYDTDADGFNGALIASGLAGLGVGQSFNWDTTGISAGTYFVYGKVDDGVNPSVFAYAPNSVTIANQAPVLSPIDDQTVDEGQTLTLFATGIDPNGDIVTYRLAAGAPEGVDIDPGTGELTWAPTEAQGPATYAITVLATDTGNPALSGSQTFQVTVGEVNAAPVLRKLFAQSRPQGGTFSFTVGADDPDSPAQTLEYSLDLNAPSGATIDPNTGVFQWPVGLTQSPGVYSVTIRATDNGTFSLSRSATVNLMVTDASSFVAPGTLEFDSATYSVDEGGQATITVKRTGGSDGVVVVQYSATSLSATAGLDFAATSGFLVFENAVTTRTFVVPTLTDSSAEGPETVTLSLNGIMGGAEFGSQQQAILTIANVASMPPVFRSSSTFNVAENQTAVGTVTATDADIPAQTLTFNITGGLDGSKFNISNAGILTFIAAPDFESPADSNADNNYQLQVTADDGHGGTATQNIMVTVIAVNDNSPVFTSSATLAVVENQTAVGTISATDADSPLDLVTFSLTGGADAAKFNLTGAGILTFLAAPDFENPNDVNSDNIYALQVTANDGHGRATPQNISVTVTEVNDNSPAFTSSPTFQVAENSTAVGVILATDADLPADSLTFAITGGADQSTFAITAGGVLSFLSAPDFELPSDNDANNIYEIQITVDDGQGHSTVQNILVTVTDIFEAGPSPELALGGLSVTWINKLPPAKVLPLLTVGGAADLNGGMLTISMNAVGTKKKSFDLIRLPEFTAFGTSSGLQYSIGHLTLQIHLNSNATNSAIESFLRGITFTTKGKGFKTLTRQVNVTLADSAAQSSFVTQMINVRKKST